MEKQQLFVSPPQIKKNKEIKWVQPPKAGRLNKVYGIWARTEMQKLRLTDRIAGV